MSDVEPEPEHTPKRDFAAISALLGYIITVTGIALQWGRFALIIALGVTIFSVAARQLNE